MNITSALPDSHITTTHPLTFLKRLILPLNTFHIPTLPRTITSRPEIVLRHLAFDQVVHSPISSPEQQHIKTWWKGIFASHSDRWRTLPGPAMIEESLYLLGPQIDNPVLDAYVEAHDKGQGIFTQQDLLPLMQKHIDLYERQLLNRLIESMDAERITTS